MIENSKVNIMDDTCDTCLYGDSDCSVDANNQGCEYHVRIVASSNESQSLEQQVKEIRQRIKANGKGLVGKKLTRHTYDYHKYGIYDDGVWSLDRYYVGLINDALHSIRHKELAWVFNLNQLKDIFRFEPDVEVKYDADDSVYYLSK